jgi:GNAT superfamily N-acetyltransferase
LPISGLGNRCLDLLYYRARAAHCRLVAATAGFVIAPLARYLQTQATQDVRRHIANCFVASPLQSNAVAGYTTLSAASIPMTGLPAEQARKLPRYPVLPAALIGRLAVDRRYQGRQLGAALLFDAIARAIRADAAVFALVVDAKDETAARLPASRV